MQRNDDFINRGAASTTAVLKAFTGLALLVFPQIVVRLFFGAAREESASGRAS